MNSFSNTSTMYLTAWSYPSGPSPNEPIVWTGLTGATQLAPTTSFVQPWTGTWACRPQLTPTPPRQVPLSVPEPLLLPQPMAALASVHHPLLTNHGHLCQVSLLRPIDVWPRRFYCRISVLSQRSIQLRCPLYLVGSNCSVTRPMHPMARSCRPGTAGGFFTFRTSRSSSSIWLRRCLSPCGKTRLLFWLLASENRLNGNLNFSRLIALTRFSSENKPFVYLRVHPINSSRYAEVYNYQTATTV